MDLSVSLIISYSGFSFFGFYQKLHIKKGKFGGQIQVFEPLLLLFSFASMLYAVSFILYYGYIVGWLEAVVLMCLSAAIKFIWFPLEAMLGLRDLYFILSLAGFVIMPICAYFMWAALPQ